jgi:hypothetical protein
MIALKKIASLFMVLLTAPAALGQVSLRRTSDEPTYAVNPATQAAFNMAVAKMAVTHTISHYLKTGEWIQVGCPQTLSPADFVGCFKADKVDGNDPQFTVVLHPNPLLNGNTFRADGDHSFLYDTAKKIYLDMNVCSCDHNSFWNLATFGWSDSDQIGDSMDKTVIATKVFSSERGAGQNYDACAAAPEDEVFYCVHGVWSTEK